MKKYNYSSIIGIIAFFVLAAGCQDNQLLNTGDSMVAGVNGVSAPGTVVTGFGEIITVGGEFEILIEDGPGVNENGEPHGTCGPGGAWTNPGGNQAQNVPHENCIDTIVVGDSVIEVTFSVFANYVQPPSGNINLNFQETEGQDIDDAYIHYQSRQDRTHGEGIIIAIDDEGNEWTVDLSQVNGDGNWFENDPLILIAVNEDDDEVELEISW